MTATRVKIDRAALSGYLRTAPELQAVLLANANKIMANSIANAPVGRSGSRLPTRGGKGKGRRNRRQGGRGYYKRHFKVTKARTAGGGYEVWNTDAFAHLVEWGSVNNPVYGPMRRAVRSAGLRYVPNPKSRGA